MLRHTWQPWFVITQHFFGFEVIDFIQKHRVPVLSQNFCVLCIMLRSNAVCYSYVNFVVLMPKLGIDRLDTWAVLKLVFIVLTRTKGEWNHECRLVWWTRHIHEVHLSSKLAWRLAATPAEELFCFTSAMWLVGLRSWSSTPWGHWYLPIQVLLRNCKRKGGSS